VVPRSHHTLAWRLFGAALGAFAIGLQFVVSAFLIVQAATVSQAGLSEADLAVICTHDPASVPSTDDGAPPAPHQHNQCPACACPQWAKVLAPLPTPPILLVLRPQSQPLHAHAGVSIASVSSPSPYSSRAPPFSA
jgi:hypothetical protein